MATRPIRVEEYSRALALLDNGLLIFGDDTGRFCRYRNNWICDLRYDLEKQQCFILIED